MTDEPPAERPAEEPSQGFAEWAWPWSKRALGGFAPSRRPVRKPRGLKPDEQRLLWITIAGTFVGGVASIVIGAAVLGIALAFAGNAKRKGDTGAVGLATVLFAVILVVSLGGYRFIRNYPLLRDTDVLVVWRGVIWFAGFFLGLGLLTWIGIAAGVK